jgi:excisionase family DNA binding protein
MSNIIQSTAGLPRFAPIPQASKLIGLGRSTIYKLAGERKLRLVKAGGRTLVDLDHAMHWLSTLPLANIAPPRDFKQT